MGRIAIFCFVALMMGVGGCDLGLSSGGAGSVVLYVITNNSGGAITYDLTMGGEIEEGLSVADGAQANRLVTCEEVTEFRMNMVCAEEGADCNILGIIIGANEVACGDIVEIVVEAAQDGMLFLSATRRQESASNNASDGGTPAGAADAAS